ncbi:MAG TPA: endonuclease/exonuclease/phosphatase family protein [Kofleriaceae bacterium]|nr:endonuclease/exonuclease/phosphatase family protein [Kofleriaceae bacterium]
MKRFPTPGASRALAFLAAVAASSPAHAGGDRASRGNKTYSVMTYNIGGKPGFTGYALDNGSSCDERARQIGQHILDMKEQPDILVFAEATGDCYKDGLVERLNEHGPYQSYVYEFVGGSAQLQDSGLMFFSKFPWTLPGVDGCPEPTFDGEHVNPVGQPEFGRAVGRFQSYSDLQFSDTYMEKGIGYACVMNPTTQQPINVFLTHNQANYWNPVDADLDDFAHDVRMVNMQEASKFIEDLAPQWRTSKRGEAVIFAGDMNTLGNDVEYWVNQGDGIDHGADGQEVEHVVLPSEVKGFTEWADNIGPGGLLDKANGLRDPWRAEGTDFPPMTVFDNWGQHGFGLGFTYDAPEVDATDMGFTWDALRNGQTDGDQSRARLDYILDRQVAFHGNEDCYQHMTVERGFTYDANPGEVQPEYVGMDLSDHYPLRAVIGPKEDQCNPKSALVDKLTPSTVTVVNGGAKKWFAYNKPGTYLIDAQTTSDLEVHVYAASDLSTDLVPREGDLTIGAGSFHGELRQNDPVTVKTDGPFFVMVSYADRAMTGSFTLNIRKNDCTSWDKAEWLTPFEAVHMGMSGPPVGTAQDRCYFKLRQDEEPADVFDADVAVLAGSMVNADHSAAAGTLKLYRSDRTLKLAGVQGTTSAALNTTMGKSSDFFYLVLERPTATQQMSFDLVWTRNITTVDVKKFTVVNQDDDNGGDEVKIFWAIDDKDADVWPWDPDGSTANGPDPTLMTYYYDGLASGASSSKPAIACATFCPLGAGLDDSHHVNIAFPDALWGFAWEIDDTSADDDLFHHPASGGNDGRFRITALDPDPTRWITPGAAANGAQVYSKNLWHDFATYSHGYRIEAARQLSK